MKHHFIIATACAGALGCTVLAAVGVRWTAETSRVHPEIIEAWRGDTLDLACTLKIYGQPVELGAATASFMWQTNGMGNAWWQTNATVAADGVIRATWSPAMDPGAGEVAFFMPVQSAGGASYRAAGRIRFRPSPGAGSQIIDLPQPGGTLDFGAYQLVNAPWATLDAVNSAIDANNAIVTNAMIGMFSEAVQSSGNALASQINAVSNAAMQRAEMGEYATTQAVSMAIAAIPIPSLAGYATEQYVADYFATNYTPPDLSSYASRSYADAAASNAQATAIAAIPSLAGYATETYAQNAAASAASDALNAAQSYARDLSWAASEGNTRLVSTDGMIWQDATGTVWQVTNVYGWAGTVIDLASSTARPIRFVYAGKTNSAPGAPSLLTDYWTAGGGTNICFDAEMADRWELWFVNGYDGSGPDEYFHADGDPPPPSTATNLTFTTPIEFYSLSYQPVALATNPVDRVLYESGGGSGSGLPGDYAAVSNAAMSAAAQTNDFLRLEGGSMRGPIRFPYIDDYGVSIDPFHPGALSFSSSYPDYSGIFALLDLSRIPTDANGNGNDEIAFLSDLPVPSAPEVTTALRWRADGTACVVTVAAGGTLTADTSNWTEGQAVMAIITLADGAGVASGIELVGYGTWPTGTPFVACCYRIGLTVFVVPSTTL